MSFSLLLKGIINTETLIKKPTNIAKAAINELKVSIVNTILNHNNNPVAIIGMLFGDRQAEREDHMTKEKFLTKRWNNWLTLALGLPTLIYGTVVLSTSVLSDFWGFIGMVIIGVVY